MLAEDDGALQNQENVLSDRLSNRYACASGEKLRLQTEAVSFFKKTLR